MKKILLLVFTMLIFASCKNDDDTTTVCSIPQNIEINDITFESAAISWNDTNPEATFSIEYGIADFALGTGTTFSLTEFSKTLTGLLANTTYDVYVKSICSETNESMVSEAVSFTTLAPLVVPEFLPNLSDLNLFSGDLSNLDPTIYAFQYKPNSVLFTDYAHKQRIVALPIGEALNYSGSDLLPDFPDNTVVAKTFYYFNNEQDESLGKQIIETRILIKINGEWQAGDYRWNNDQTDAILDQESSTHEINYIDQNGEAKFVTYKIPSNTDCFTCHAGTENLKPIALKLRSLNYNNQLQDLIDNNYLTGINDPSTIATVPDYNDLTETLENRARAYFDANCAYCHSPSGFCETQSPLRLAYETSFDDSKIYEQRFSIDFRMANYLEGVSMPFIGTTMIHAEGYALIQEFLDNL
jgi:hypothetical protein